MDEFRFTATVPILRIFSIEKAKEFYCDFLGFSIDWEFQFGDNTPLYIQVSLGELRLHLSEHHGDASPGAGIHVEMTGIDAFHRAITAKQYKYLNPGINDAPWGARVLSVIDPFGNRLSFNEYNKKIGTAE